MTTPPRVGFVLEQSLGHVTHADNLMTIVPQTGIVDPVFRTIPFAVDGVAARLPLYGSNWTVRAGLRARSAIRSMARAGRLDGLFIHTQVPAVLAGRWLERVPTVVSVDATPLQYDRLGEHYNHGRGSDRIERWKWKANRDCFRRARHVVAWSQWAKDGLVDEYEADASLVTVIPPGVPTSRWLRPAQPRDERGPIRILFVGADLERKGGSTLLSAFRKVRATLPDDAVELHLVTKSTVEAEPGVVAHHGMAPNSAELIALYHSSDVFCLPTKGDCLPMVLSEAGAAGLPLVSTDVGAIPEIVRDGETGRIVPVGDDGALAAALGQLVDDRDGRLRMGAAASALVVREFDAERNSVRLAELLRSVATGTPAT